MALRLDLDGGLLVRDLGSGLFLTEDEECCCPFTCADLYECYGDLMDATVVINGIADGSCTDDCEEINGTYVITGMNFTTGGVGGPNCYYQGGISFELPLCIVTVGISLLVGRFGGTWVLSGEIVLFGVGTEFRYQRTGLEYVAPFCTDGFSVGLPQTLVANGRCNGSGGSFTVIGLDRG